MRFAVKSLARQKNLPFQPVSYFYIDLKRKRIMLFSFALIWSPFSTAVKIMTPFADIHNFPQDLIPSSQRQLIGSPLESFHSAKSTFSSTDSFKSAYSSNFDRELQSMKDHASDKSVQALNTPLNSKSEIESSFQSSQSQSIGSIDENLPLAKDLLKSAHSVDRRLESISSAKYAQALNDPLSSRSDLDFSFRHQFLCRN
jgi:hypothetical protein